jgi:hypothetical protein
LSNHEMPEEQSDELDQALAAILRKYSGVKE